MGNMETGYLSALLSKYLKGTIKEREQEILETWFKEQCPQDGESIDESAVADEMLCILKEYAKPGTNLYQAMMLLVSSRL